MLNALHERSGLQKTAKTPHFPPNFVWLTPYGAIRLHWHL